MTAVVLDASVLVAIFLDEARAKNIAHYLDRDLYVSTVNVAETAEVLRRKNEQITPDMIRSYLERLRVDIVPFSLHQAFVAGNFARMTRAKGLSLADNACLALAADMDAEILTTDSVWATLDMKLVIHLLQK